MRRVQFTDINGNLVKRDIVSLLDRKSKASVLMASKEIAPEMNRIVRPAYVKYDQSDTGLNILSWDVPPGETIVHFGKTDTYVPGPSELIATPARMVFIFHDKFQRLYDYNEDDGILWYFKWHKNGSITNSSTNRVVQSMFSEPFTKFMNAVIARMNVPLLDMETGEDPLGSKYIYDQRGQEIGRIGPQFAYIETSMPFQEALETMRLAGGMLQLQFDRKLPERFHMLFLI